MQHSGHLHCFRTSCLALKAHLLLLFLCDPSCDTVLPLWVQAKQSSPYSFSVPYLPRPSPGRKEDWPRALGIGVRRDDPLNARKMERVKLFAGDLACSPLPHLWL